jgi:hypothetical protein
MTSSLILTGDHHRPTTLSFSKNDVGGDNNNDENFDGTVVDESLPSHIDRIVRVKIMMMINPMWLKIIIIMVT